MPEPESETGEPAEPKAGTTPPSHGPDDGARTVIAPAGRVPAGPSDSPASDDGTRIADLPPPAAAPSRPRLVPPGTLINNNYRIEQLISTGGMGEVYRATNVFTGDPVAVKCILPELASDDAMIALFRSEARVLVQLRHDAIVRYHNFVRDPVLDRYCLIMEFVEGPHLGEHLRAGQAMVEAEAVHLMRRLADGLAQVHARGIVHRDLSPDNVILRHGHVSEAVMIDFGIARGADGGDVLGGRFAGKFKYIAPEQLGHAGGVTGAATDIYGLALLIAALVRGQPLDMGDSVVSASAARQAIPDLSGISHRLYPLLQFMLEPDPAARPADMDHVVAILDDPARLPVRYRLPRWPQADEGAPQESGSEGLAALSDSPFAVGSTLASGLAPVGAPAGPVSVAPTTPRRWLWAAAAAAVLAASAAGWLTLRPPAQPPDPAVTEDTADPLRDLPPPDLPPRDMTTRDGFLAGQDLPNCALIQRIPSGPQAGTIESLSDAALDTAPLLDAYQSAFGARPEIVPHRIAAAQCPAIAFARELAGRPAAPLALQATAEADAGGTALRATVSGLGERSPWVFLIAPDGSLYDLTARTTQMPGGDLGLGVSIAGSGGGGTYLLAATASAAPLTSVAAAPAQARANDLLPAVMKELRRLGASPTEAPGVAIMPLTFPDSAAPVPQPTDDADTDR